jgi:hypothetical protein
MFWFALVIARELQIVNLVYHRMLATNTSSVTYGMIYKLGRVGKPSLTPCPQVCLALAACW